MFFKIPKTHYKTGEKQAKKNLGPSFDATLDQVLTQKTPNLGPSLTLQHIYIYMKDSGFLNMAKHVLWLGALLHFWFVVVGCVVFVCILRFEVLMVMWFVFVCLVKFQMCKTVYFPVWGAFGGVFYSC